MYDIFLCTEVYLAYKEPLEILDVLVFPRVQCYFLSHHFINNALQSKMYAILNKFITKTIMMLLFKNLNRVVSSVADFLSLFRETSSFR